jgi:hypothetical protein
MARPVNPNFGKSTNRTSFKRNYLKFQVDFQDINKELGVFIKALGKDLSLELKSKHTGEKMAKGPIRNLQETFSPKSGRVKTLMKAIMHKPKYGFESSGNKIGRFNIRRAHVKVANIGYLDQQTKISTLDKRFPPRHNAPFAGNPLKKTGQASKSKHSLWRILEYVTKNRYPIKAQGPMSLRYTTNKDNNSRWHIARTVTWYGTNRGAFSAYYLLDSSRRVYKDDQAVFSREIKRGVKKIIETKTRFKR